MMTYSELKKRRKEAANVLLAHKGELSRHEYRTLKGQIYKGDFEGFSKGLETLMRRKRKK